MTGPKPLVGRSTGETLQRPPQAYTRDLYARNCAGVYHHVYESYYGEGRSAYSVAA